MKTPALMIQGTTSDAGKSLLVTALCRWLARQGVRVAPFKPQNMALNSAVTVDGGEIGRAQAAQAIACGLQPHTDMNPVLLKPNTDTGAQVIIQGRAVATMNARDYQGYKAQARVAVLESFRRLTDQYDVVLVEGAGTPAEINLRAQDIANMGFAEAVDCPVVLIADIDRGGVFAHIVGTLELLSASERDRVQGFIINRFRGDLALLQPGLDWLEQRTGKPVLGVLPFLPGLALEAEDGLARPPSRPGQAVSGKVQKDRGTTGGDEDWDTTGSGYQQPTRNPTPASLRILVPSLPRLSNRTDFDALCLHPQVELDFIGPGRDLPPADLIILPGSKSVRADLAWLRQQGWEAAIRRHLRYGGKVIGICGGYQMLGNQIHDPLGLEGPPGSSAGLGLLDLETTLAPEKQLRNVRGHLTLGESWYVAPPDFRSSGGAKSPAGIPVSGYEIHAGVTQGPDLERPAVYLDQVPDGALSGDGQILGTYLHGLFDTPAACTALLAWAGLDKADVSDYQALREATFDRLADAVDQHLDPCWLASLRIGSVEITTPAMTAPAASTSASIGSSASSRSVQVPPLASPSDISASAPAEPFRALVLGGVRSGKSQVAERLALESGLPVTYLATATAGDAEMHPRIARHRARRPASWGLVEEPIHLAAALQAHADPGRCLLVDCLTLWLTNLLLAADGEALDRERAALLKLLPTLPGRLILVSNETGLGGIAMGELGRRFDDAAGQLHQDLAPLCDQVILTVVGLPLSLKGGPG